MNDENQVPPLRPSWDEYFMRICDVVASRSHDRDTKVGCVIVNPKRRIVSTGYNGLPAGVDDAYWATMRNQIVHVPSVNPASQEIFDVNKYDTVTHAEANAIVSAAEGLHGCHAYVSLFPCNDCAKLVITAGIRRVYYRTIRDDKACAIAKVLFDQAGVELIHVQIVSPSST